MVVGKKEGGRYSAHYPDVPGVYGTGPTREAALADLEEAKSLLTRQDAGQAEDDAEDIRLADEALADLRATGITYTHEEVLRMYGLAPVKVGIVSDIHGDIFALDTALGHLRRMGCDPVLCAGDLLDVEPFGEEVVQRCKAEKMICIRGNHERWAIERRRRRPDPRRLAPSIVEMPDLFNGGAELSREALAWLAALPSHWSAELASVRVAVWHARPGSDLEGILADATGPALGRLLLDQAAADVLIVGHTHVAFDLSVGNRRILNPGACCSKIPTLDEAVAAPDTYRPATFGVLELPSKCFTVFQAADGAELGESEALRLVESRLADLDAGRSRAIPLEEAMREHGIAMPPRRNRP